VDELVEASALDVRDRLEWRLDPELLGFRRVCGRVVKRDATTDEKLPVPNATVHVEDTDCNFLGYFPPDGLWGWLHPFMCTRETVATVETDACGRFCVYVPRWDIDRVLRFRRERVCLPDLVDPSIEDLLDHLEIRPDPPIVEPPQPRPDPDPFPLREPGVYARLRGLIGPDRTERLFALTGENSLGDSTREVDELLAEPATSGVRTPPAPDELPDLVTEQRGRMQTRALATRATVEEEVDFEPRNFVGPFLRCRDVTVPEWTTILDVPDITFRVTQDVDGDGTEEEIYSEGYFDVRWNDLPDDEVVLEADEIAVTVGPCDPIPSLPECETPSLRLLGAMPLASTYHSNGGTREGYALRVNRPRPGSADAATPYAGRLNLYGCGFRTDQADYYRLVYRYRADPGDTPTTARPFSGLDWFAVRENWPPVREHIQPVDDQGWYEIPDPAVLADRYQNLLLHWDTRHDSPNDDGLYDVRLELADGGKNRIDEGDWLTLRVDNSRPTVRFDGLRWRTTDGTAGGSLPLECPVLRRPLDANGHPKPVAVDVAYTVSHPHLRNLGLTASGCGDGSPTRQGPADDFSVWYDSPSKTSHSRTDATFRLAGGDPDDGGLAAGAYAFELSAWNRAFNPTRATNGIDRNWEIDPSHVGRHERVQVAVVNGR
jgi:hypothetical protein